MIYYLILFSFFKHCYILYWLVWARGQQPKPTVKLNIPPIFINKVPLKHSHAPVSSVAVFPLPWQSSVVMTETPWLLRPKIFTVWSFTENCSGQNQDKLGIVFTLPIAKNL